MSPRSPTAESASAEDEDIPLIPAECIFFVGSSVQTPYGCGTVLAFRAIDGMYEIAIHPRSWALAPRTPASPFSPPLPPNLVKVYMHGSELTWEWRADPGTAVSTTWGTGLLLDVRESDGIHIVALREMGSASWLVGPSGGGGSSSEIKATAAAAAAAKLQHQRSMSGSTLINLANTAAAATESKPPVVTAASTVGTKGGPDTTPLPSPSPSPLLRGMPAPAPSPMRLSVLSLGSAVTTSSITVGAPPPAPAPAVPTPKEPQTVAGIAIPPGTVLGYLNPGMAFCTFRDVSSHSLCAIILCVDRFGGSD